MLVRLKYLLECGGVLLSSVLQHEGHLANCSEDRGPVQHQRIAAGILYFWPWTIITPIQFWPTVQHQRIAAGISPTFRANRSEDVFY